MKKVLLPSFLATFWRNLQEASARGVALEVEHEGDTYDIEKYDGNTLRLTTKEGRRISLIQTQDGGCAPVTAS